MIEPAPRVFKPAAADVAPLPVWGSSGFIASLGMASALRGVPAVSSRQRCVHGQQGEVKTTKNRNGHAGWNAGANQSAFVESAAV